MFTAEKKGRKDYMGFAWFEVFKNGKSTGYSYNVLDEDHAIAIHNKFTQSI